MKSSSNFSKTAFLSALLIASILSVNIVYAANLDYVGKGDFSDLSSLFSFIAKVLQQPSNTGGTGGSTNIGQGATAPTISVSVDNPNPPVDKVVTISATASDNSKVSTIKIYVDNVLAKTCTINAKSGSCYYRPVYNAEGKHTFYAIAVDDSGISNRDPASGTKTITVGADVTKPTVSVSHSPANPVEGQVVKIIATAKDNQKLSKIEIYEDDTLMKTCNVDSEIASCVFESEENSVNKFTYYAKATDASGLTATTTKQSYNVVADTIAPIVDISINPANPKAGEVITFTATATDSCCRYLSSIDIFTDDIKQYTCNIGNKNTFTCSVQTVYGSEGSHTFYATATDTSSNSNKGTSAKKSFTLAPSTDKVAPEVDVNLPVIWGVGGQEPVVGETFTIRASAHNINGSETIAEGSSMNIDIYTVKVDSVAASGPARASITVCIGSTCSISTTFNDGEIKIIQIGTQSAEVYVHDIVLGRAAIVDISSADDYGPMTSIKIYVDDKVQKTCTVSHQNGKIVAIKICDFTISYNAIGAHTYYATATDSSNNIGRGPVSGTKTFTVVADTEKPTVWLDPLGPTFQTGETINLAAYSSDNAKTKVMFLYVDGQQIATCPIVPLAVGGSCKHKTGFYTEGKHTWYAEAVDFSDNKGKSEVRSFTVVDPLTVSVSHNPSNPKVNEAVSITATATDDEEVSSMSVCIDSDPCIFKSIIAKSGTHTVKKTYQKEGKHTYYATAVDKRGNIHRYPATGTKTFTVGKPPTVTVTHSPLNPKVNEKVTFTATASDDVKLRAVSIMLPNNIIYGCTPANAVSWTCTTTKTFSTAGTYTYSAQAIDGAGQITNTDKKSFTVSK